MVTTKLSTVSNTVIGSGTDLIVLDLAEDAYEGNAQFTVEIDGQQVGGTETVSALQSSNQDQQFTIEGSWGSGPNSVIVNFLNYASDGQTGNGHDRALFVDGVTYNGQNILSEAQEQTSSGDMVYSTNAPPSTLPTPFPLGVYVGFPANWSSQVQATFVADLDNFEKTMGAAPSFLDVGVDFNSAISTWTNNMNWVAASVTATPQLAKINPVISFPLASSLDNADTDFKAFASGQYDNMITNMVSTWAADGYKTQYWRVGWEMNIVGMGSYAGAKGSQEQQDWITAYQHVYTVLHRAATADGVTVDVVWNPGNTPWSASGNAVTQFYPGSQYVDVIGADVYADPAPYSLYDFSTGQTDSSLAQWEANPVNLRHYYEYPAATQWSNDGSGGYATSLLNLINLAQSTGKPLGICETGAGDVAGNDLKDNPIFVQWLAQTLHQANVPVQFVNLWDAAGAEFSNPTDGKPLEAAAWAQYFGAAPTISVTSQILAADTGVSATDGVTSNGSVTLTGAFTGASGTVVQIFDGSAVIGTAIQNGGGGWSFATTLKAGLHALHAVAKDPAGDTATSTTQSTITVETVAPAVAITSETQATGSTLITLAGTLSGPTGTTVELYNGSAALGAANVSSNGTWTYSGNLASATYNVTAQATDPAGNVGVSSKTTFTVAMPGSNTGASPSIGTLVLNMSEDAYQGDADFTVSVDGKQFGNVEAVTSAHSLGGTEAFTFVGNFGAAPHTVSVDFLNDLWGGPGTVGEDRNLYVSSITMNGTTTTENAAQDGAGTVPYSVPGGSGNDTLVLNMSEDAYQGDAEFTVSVNGQQIGSIETLTALHAQAQSQDFTLTGNFGSGPPMVAVDFLNDKWGGPGTVGKDRNVYVNSITLNGARTVEDATQYSSGAANYAVQRAVTITGTSGNDTLKGASSTNLLIGNGGNDVYVAQATDQNDTIANGMGGSTNAAGTLELAFNHSQLWFEQSGNDLLIDVLGTDHHVVIENWYNGGQQLAEIVSGDGLKVDANLQGLVQAMGHFSAVNPTFNPITTNQNSLANSSFGSLASTDARAWHN